MKKKNLKTSLEIPAKIYTSEFYLCRLTTEFYSIIKIKFKIQSIIKFKLLEVDLNSFQIVCRFTKKFIDYHNRLLFQKVIVMVLLTRFN